MGILSDTNSRLKLSKLLVKYSNILSFLCYVGGFIAFLMMAYMPFNNGTYFSENALLPGVVDGEYYGGADATTYMQDYNEILKRHEGEVPIDWLQAKFRDLGLDVYQHNFSYVLPLGISQEKIINAKNVYGILRAPKAASTETLVLSTPIRSSDIPLSSNAAGVGLLLAMAKFFKRHSYWAKDVIFLMTDQEALGMQAWLEVYHSLNSDYIRSDVMHGRAGSIQAAINIEIESSHIGYFDIRVEGLNGQLPNLDLVNLCTRLCEKERIRAALHHRFDYWQGETPEGFKHSLKTYLAMMWHQASGSASGNHGLFHRYGIEAVTLAGIKSKRVTSKQGFTPMGRVLEGIFRSLNNLQERFHQSFFFYLLPSTDRYVSIGVYMPPFAVMALGLLIKALALWFGEDEKVIDKKENDPKAEGDVLKEKEEKSSPFLTILPYMIMCQIFGLVAFVAPSYMTQSANSFSLELGESLALGFLALQASSMIFPWMLKRKSVEVEGNDWKLMKCLTLLHQGLILYPVAVMNVSLAFFLAAVLVPISLIIYPTRNRFGKLLFRLLLLLTAPFTLLCIASVLQNAAFYTTVPFQQLLLNSWSTLKNSLFWGMVDFYLLGNWLFVYLAVAIYPNWLMLWSLTWMS